MILLSPKIFAVMTRDGDPRDKGKVCINLS
jgi:hypothetical protein